MISGAVKETLYGLVSEDNGSQESEESFAEFTVGQILRDNLLWILNNTNFSEEQKKAAGMMAACKTPALGTYVDYCPHCDKVIGVRYRSCNNRNCPGCQHPLQEKWIELRKSEVVDNTPYFHLIMTLPHELNSLVAENPRLLLGILFRCSAQAVMELCADPKYLGAKPGIISVLHTWTQDLKLHYHIHMICSAGGLNPAGEYISLNSRKSESGVDQKHLMETNKSDSIRKEEHSEFQDEPEFASTQKNSASDSAGFFLPLKAVTSLFRGKYMAELKKLYSEHKLSLPPDLDYLENPREWAVFCDKLYRTDWIGYIARTFNGNGNAIDYLARYTFRTAISNGRITDYDGQKVTFLVRDNDNPGKRIPKVLEAHVFISRLLQHILPKGFTRVRFYGFLSNGQKTKKLYLIHKQLEGKAYSPSPIKELKGMEMMRYLYPDKAFGCCPICKNSLDTYFFQERTEQCEDFRRSRDAPAA